jgi:hypothetical protein
VKLRTSQLSGEYNPITLFDSGLPDPDKFPTLTVEENGGFESYSLLSAGQTLPGYAAMVLQLQK